MNPMMKAIMKKRMSKMGPMDEEESMPMMDEGMMDGEEDKASKEEQDQTKAAGLAPERVGEEEGPSVEIESENISPMGNKEEKSIEMPLKGEMSDEQMLQMAEMLYDKDNAGKPGIMGKAAAKMKAMMDMKNK